MHSSFEKKCANCGRIFTSSVELLRIGSRIRVCSLGHLWFNCPCSSTLFIPKGNFEWFSFDSLLSRSARKEFAKSKSMQDIPRIQSNIMKLQEVLEDTASNNQEVSRELKLNPSLAILVLSMASHLNPQGKEIKDIDHAISLIGRKDLSGLILSASLVNQKLKTKHYSIKNFWEEALCTGAISRIIAAKFGNPSLKNSIDRAYLGACFSKLGKLVAAITEPETVDSIHQIISNPKTMTSWKNAAKSISATGLEVFGEIGARMWGLPEFACEVIVNFERAPCTEEGEGLDLIECCQLSSILFYWLNSSPHLIAYKRLQHFQQKLDFNDTAIEEFLQKFNSQKDKIGLLVEDIV